MGFHLVYLLSQSKKKKKRISMKGQRPDWTSLKVSGWVSNTDCHPFISQNLKTRRHISVKTGSCYYHLCSCLASFILLGLCFQVLLLLEASACLKVTNGFIKTSFRKALAGHALISKNKNDHWKWYYLRSVMISTTFFELWIRITKVMIIFCSEGPPLIAFCSLIQFTLILLLCGDVW